MKSKSGFITGGLSNFKGNFSYQPSNICINTVIKLTWNSFPFVLLQDVNKKWQFLMKLFYESNFVTLKNQQNFLIKGSLKSIAFRSWANKMHFCDPLEHDKVCSVHRRMCILVRFKIQVKFKDRTRCSRVSNASPAVNP